MENWQKIKEEELALSLLKRLKFLQKYLDKTPDRYFHDLNKIVEEVTIPKGTFVYDIGDYSDSFYLVRDGAIQLETTL